MGNGYDILGASADRVITVRVKNALALAKGQSALASGLSNVASLIPGAKPQGDDFIEGQAYEAIAAKINESLAAQKANAEVRVIDGSGIIPQPRTYFSAPAASTIGPLETESEAWKFTKTYGWGMITGLGLSGLAALAWHYFVKTKENA